jgi:hypothetical protein
VQTAQAFVETQQRAVDELHFGVVASSAFFNVSQCAFVENFSDLFQ